MRGCGFSGGVQGTLAHFGSVHTDTRSSHWPVHTLLIYLLTLCSGYSQGRAAWCGLQLLAGALLPCEEGHFPTGSDGGQGQAARPGPRLSGAESTGFRDLGAELWVPELGMRVGVGVQCCGSRAAQCAWALGHVPESSEGQDCQGTAAALPSVLTPGRGAVLPNGAPGAPRGDQHGRRHAEAEPWRWWPFTRCR